MPKAKSTSSRFFGGSQSHYFARNPNRALPPGCEGDPCPACLIDRPAEEAGTLKLRDGRFGPFIGCTSFPRCRHRQAQPGGDGDSSPKRRGRCPAVRVEIESRESIRAWCSGRQEPAALGAILNGVTLPVLSTDARADWAPAVAARTTAIFALSAYDELLHHLRKPAADAPSASAIGGRGRSRRSTRSATALERAAPPAPPPPPPPPTLTVDEVPETTLAFFRSLPAATPPDADAAAEHAFTSIPARLRNTLLPFQRSGIVQLLRWGGRGASGRAGVPLAAAGMRHHAHLPPWLRHHAYLPPPTDQSRRTSHTSNLPQLQPPTHLQPPTAPTSHTPPTSHRRAAER